jgi:hypothetical protein
MDNDNYFSDHYHHQKYKRPGLRSTVSELPTSTGMKPFYLDAMSLPKKSFHSVAALNSRKYLDRYSSSGEEDEENAPLLYYSSSSGSKRRSTKKKKRQDVLVSNRFRWLRWIGLSLFLLITCGSLFIFLAASELKSVEIVSISNVLGTQKQLIFDLHVTAR